MPTYYVDYANGNDTTGDGSSLTPWKTIGKFFTSGANNDTCKVRGSSAAPHYEASISTVKTGLTIEADTGHTPEIRGSTGYATWAATGGTTNVYQTTCTTVAAAIYSVWNGTTKLTSTANVGACDALTNSFFIDDPGDLLHVNIGGSAPTQIEVVSTWSPNFLIMGAGATVRNLNFKYFGKAALSCTTANWTISGCTFSLWGPPFSVGCISISSTGATISSCTFTITGTEYPFAWAAGAGTATITGCTITNPSGLRVTVGTGHIISNTTVAGVTGGGVIPSIYISGTATACTITGCTTTSGAYGIKIDAGTDHVVTNCTCSNVTGDGIQFLTGVTATVSYCTTYDTYHAGFYATGAGCAITYHHCLAYSTHDIGQGYGWVCHTTAAITCYHCIAAFASRCTGIIRAGFYVLDAGSSLTLRNCIAYSNLTGIQAEAGTTYDVDYCLCNGNTNDYSGLSPGAHDVTGDPLFVSTVAYSEDFHLRSGSPCINTGVALVGFNDGFVGAAPDIGMYETAALVTSAISRLRRR